MYKAGVDAGADSLGLARFWIFIGQCCDGSRQPNRLLICGIVLETNLIG